MASDISYHYYFTTPARLGDENTNVVLFPNPNTGTFDIALNGYEGQQVNIQIVSALGQTVYNNTVNVNATGFTQNVNLNNAAAGMYYVNILTDKGVMNYQVVITD